MWTWFLLPAVAEVLVDPVAVGALGELIATAIVAAVGKSWKEIRSNPEALAVRAAASRALETAFRDAYRHSAIADDAWVVKVAELWRPAFTPAVSLALVRCLASPEDREDEFVARAAQALRDSGCDLAELGRTFWVEQFLSVLPRLLLKELEDAALDSGSGVRDLVGHVLKQRAEARAARSEGRATPSEFRDDVLDLLRRLDTAARTSKLPPYLPPGADVTRLARAVRVRRGVRSGFRPGGSAGEPIEAESGRAYRLPVDRAGDAAGTESVMPWPEVASRYRRVVVLADPGMGKSWLIRTETCRLCQQALAAADTADVADTALIPIPLRCDELAAVHGASLPEAVVAHLVAQQLLPPRSKARLRALVEAGRVVLLLDALDELATDQQYGPVKKLLRAWHEQTGGTLRCVVTSRIAGYRGSPLPDAHEVELQAFTSEDVSAAVASWSLPPSVAARVLNRVKDPAVAGMTRVPLLLALLCSLAAELPEGQALPATRAELYERMLRWFLTRPHRADEHPARPETAPGEVDALLGLLTPVAYHFAATPAGWTDLMPPGPLADAICSVDPAFTSHQRAHDLIQELSVGAGILVPAGDPSAGRPASYLFLHRTFAEYLVARHLAALPEADWLEVVDQHLWFDPDWAEVIPLLGSQLGPAGAQRLAQHLLGQAHDPFCHALLTAVRVITELPNRDHVLPSGELQALGDRVLQLIVHPATWRTTAAVLAGAGMLPRPLIDGWRVGPTGQNPRVRIMAAEKLEGVDSPPVVDWLLTLLDDPDPRVRWTTVSPLARLDAPGITDRLAALLDDQDWEMRERALSVLAGRDSPTVSERLLTLLDELLTLLNGLAPDAKQAAMVRALERQDSVEATVSLEMAILDGDVWKMRRDAILALAGRDSPTVTGCLLTLLDDSDQEVRGAAVSALAGVRTPEVIDRLLARLSDQDQHVRRAAIEALAGQDSPTVTGGLLTLLKDQHWAVRKAAIKALASIDAPEVTNQLMAMLDDPHSLVLEAEVAALAERHTPGIADRLLRVDDRATEVRLAKAGALADQAMAMEWVDPELIAELLLPLCDEDWLIRSVAKTALERQDPLIVTDVLMDLFSDPEPGWRMVAAKATNALGLASPEVTDALLALLGDEEWIVRLAAVDALSRRGAAGLTDGLLALLDDQHWPVRRSAVQALAGRDGPGVTEGLLTLLDDEIPDVRLATVNGLAKRNGPAVTDRLLALLDDQDREVRRAAVKALAGRHAPQVRDRLMGLFDDQDWQVRHAAGVACGTPEFLDQLRVLLNGENPMVRETAVWALAQLDTQEVTDQLLRLLDDRDFKVRWAAATELIDRDAPGVTEGLLTLLCSRHAGMSGRAEEGLERREDRELGHSDDVADLLTLTGLVQMLNPSAIRYSYRLAERLVSRAYLRLPAGSRADVRANLSWLTTAVLADAD